MALSRHYVDFVSLHHAKVPTPWGTLWVDMPVTGMDRQWCNAISVLGLEEYLLRAAIPIPQAAGCKESG